MQRIVTMMSLICSSGNYSSAKLDILLRFSTLPLLTSKYANVVPWVLPFYKKNRGVVCILMQLVEMTNNRLMQAPSSSNNQQVPQWKCNPLRKETNAITNTTTATKEIYKIEKEDCFHYTQVTTSAHNKRQPGQLSRTLRSDMILEDLTAKNQQKA